MLLRKKMYPRYLLLLALVIYTVFYIAPSLLGVYYSFTDMTIYKPTGYGWVGLRNYANLISQNRFKTGMANTFSFMIITTIMKNLLSFALALALNMKLRTKNALRAVFYLPVILSTLIVSKIFSAMLLPDTGLINRFLGVFSKSEGSEHSAV